MCFRCCRSAPTPPAGEATSAVLIDALPPHVLLTLTSAWASFRRVLRAYDVDGTGMVRMLLFCVSVCILLRVNSLIKSDHNLFVCVYVSIADLGKCPPSYTHAHYSLHLLLATWQACSATWCSFVYLSDVAAKSPTVDRRADQL